VLSGYALALAHDPKAPVPEFPPVDASADALLSYDRLSAPERLAADLEATPLVNRQRAAN
jgi:hypothetical protein